MSESSQVRRFMARVEFIACMEDVESMLRQGFSKQLIYERLQEEGRISMAYVTFAKLISKAARNDLPLTSLKLAVKPADPPPSPKQIEQHQPPPPVSRPQRPPGIIRAESKTFPDPRVMNPNDSF